MKQPYVIVLAGSTREGRRYAKLAGLPKGRHRVVFSAKQIRHLRHAEIHELPSFKRRPDRHGINAALRYTKGERKLVEMPADVEQDSRGPLTQRQLEVAYRFNALRETPALDAVSELAKAEELDALDGLKQVSEVRSNVEAILAKAEDSAAILQEFEDKDGEVEDQGDGMGPQLTIEGDEEPVEPKAPIRRRRTRCKLCDNLVAGDDDPAHDAVKHAEANRGVTLPNPDAPAKPVDPRSFFGG